MINKYVALVVAAAAASSSGVMAGIGSSAMVAA